MLRGNDAIFLMHAGQTDSIVVAKSVTKYTLSHLQPATEYEITLKSIRGREESEPLSHMMYTGMEYPFKVYSKFVGLYISINEENMIERHQWLGAGLFTTPRSMNYSCTVAEL